MSKSRVDRLGDRLRAGILGNAELEELSAYRATFGPAYRSVFDTVRSELLLDPTGRPAKSTPAIIEKLRRESIRLSQVQDIAGLRIIVPQVTDQDRTTERISALFERVEVVDRRAKPSHGYRAVHIVVFIEGLPVEVQIRTELQHLWAEISEKVADLLGSEIKYGGGPPSIRSGLAVMAKNVQTLEGLEREVQGDASTRELAIAVDRGRARLATELDDILQSVVALRKEVE